MQRAFHALARFFGIEAYEAAGGAVLRDLFRKSGRPLERELDLVPVEPMREHRFEDGTSLAMPSGSRADQLTAVEEALGPEAGQSWVDGMWQSLQKAGAAP